MKFNYKSIFFLLLAMPIAGIFTACSDDDEVTGTPMVEYVRVTRPEASDSLLVAAGQGATIAIMGQNLQGTTQVWFNDRRASLNPNYITATTIITTVPSAIPLDITNEMKLVFGPGDTLIHNFEVAISEPLITGMVNEYAPIGTTATIRGDYFYDPTVTFTGEDGASIEAEVVSISTDYQRMQVTVPEGAIPGPVTVTTNFGETESDFWFHDNRNIIASFDITTNGLWHGPNYIKATDDNFTAINGKFLRIDKNPIGGWFEIYVGPADSDVRLETKNIPEDALVNPDDYVMKFEINTREPLTGSTLNMYFGQDMANDRNNIRYQWKDNVSTSGNWQTVIIPFADIYEANKFAYNPEGYGVSFHFTGSDGVVGDFALDNMRIVPKVIE